MADKSISFCPAMATAVLTGRKTMTRRLLADGKPLPYAPGDTIWCRETHYRTGYWEQHYKTDQALRDNKITPPEALARAALAKQLFNGVRLFLVAHQMAQPKPARQPKGEPDIITLPGPAE